MPVPEPSRELWDELVQAITSSNVGLTDRMESSRKSFLNEAKRTRNMALRSTTMDRKEAETRVYNDHIAFFDKNVVSIVIENLVTVAPQFHHMYSPVTSHVPHSLFTDR